MSAAEEAPTAYVLYIYVSLEIYCAGSSPVRGRGGVPGIASPGCVPAVPVPVPVPVPVSAPAASAAAASALRLAALFAREPRPPRDDRRCPPPLSNPRVACVGTVGW